MEGEADSRPAASRLSEPTSDNDHTQETPSSPCSSDILEDQSDSTRAGTQEIDNLGEEREAEQEPESVESEGAIVVLDDRDDSEQEQEQEQDAAVPLSTEVSSSSQVPKSLFPVSQTTSRLVLSSSQGSGSESSGFLPNNSTRTKEPLQRIFPQAATKGLLLSGSGSGFGVDDQEKDDDREDQGQEHTQEQSHGAQDLGTAQGVHEEEEEELPTIYPPLSETTFEKIEKKSSASNSGGLPPAPALSAVASLPEEANSLRWDTQIQADSDAELEDGFRTIKSKAESLSKSMPENQPERTTESPFAPFLPKSSPPATESKTENLEESVAEAISEMVNHSGLYGNFLSNDMVESLKDGTALDKLKENAVDALKDGISLDKLKEKAIDVLKESLGGDNQEGSDTKDSHSGSRHVLEGMTAAGAGGLLLKSFLSSRESEEEFSSNGEHNERDRVSSRESTPAPRRYTAAEKGKASVRDALEIDDISMVSERSSREELRQSRLFDTWDDLPPINSVAGVDYKTGMAPVSMFSPTPVSPPVRSENEFRSRIYPTAPPAPWEEAPAASFNGFSKHRSPALSTRSPSNGASHDPNLAFMSSSRSAKTVTPPQSTTTVKPARSLLSDYPDVPSKPKTTSVQPIVTLPRDPAKAPVLRGKYELPTIKTIDQWRSKNGLAPNAFRRLLVNIGGLFVSNYVMRASLYRSATKLFSSIVNPSIIFWLEWAWTILLLVNIIEVGVSYFTGTNNFENAPLTVSQRTLLALDPVVSKVPGEVPIFRKSINLKHSATERPIMSTYVSPSAGAFTQVRAPFQKASASLAASEYRDAATILNKSMSRSFNQSVVQDKADLLRLMKNVEAREELQAEWKGVDTDPSKRQFGLHSTFGAPQSGIQGGLDMSKGVNVTNMGDNASRPDILGNFPLRGNLGRFQPALRTTLSKDHTSKADLQKDGLYVVGHSKVLKSLNLTEVQLDRWALNMRKWMWNNIVSHICKDMELVDEGLAKIGLSYLDCKSATMFYTSGPLPKNNTSGPTAATTLAPAPAPAPTNSLGWGAASIATTRLPSAFATTSAQPQQSQLPASLQELEAHYGQEEIVKKRLVLEMYLAIPGYANRKYVVERLQAMGPVLTHFIWNSNGVTWDGGRKSWTAELPTDAQIIMHLFTVYMDLAMPTQSSQSYDRFMFSFKHYVPQEAKPDASTSLQIKQTSKSPPNYNLVVEGSMWEVIPQRLNVWYTLVLFVYMVMKESGGYMGQTHIGTQGIGLGDVVEGCDL